MGGAAHTGFRAATLLDQDKKRNHYAAGLMGAATACDQNADVL